MRRRVGEACDQVVLKALPIAIVVSALLAGLVLTAVLRQC